MPNFRYAREYTTVYPDVLTEHGSLVAEMDTVYDWPEAPVDGRWVPVEPPAPLASPAVPADIPPAATPALD